ncbi:uncharacterized protein LOC129924978 isoform X2 [Biomphalaria glabrata]|uniref:Uncharacterized protein LOC129924978 isoform X2 n=1 Tax=Biomphalaria glabrata TaxID=6526 RepID=A0A9W2ZUS9_BIOGL|nr:uncharacterized protein LOC129924978 isoform X2 [Biomphalaria glabrata]
MSKPSKRNFSRIISAIPAACVSFVSMKSTKDSRTCTPSLSMTTYRTAEIDEGNRGDGNEVELEEQKRTKENLRKRMREVKKLDITTDNLVKSLESSLKEKEHEVKQEQQRNRELDAKFKNLLQEKVLKLSFKKYLIIITQRSQS